MEIDRWKMFEEAIKLVGRVYIWGPPGIGKSYAGQKALKITNNDLVWQITLNEDVIAQELLGHYVPKGKIFEWHDGPVTKAFRDGGGLIINELSRASGAVKDMFLGILDDFEVASLSLPTGERLKPKKGFKVVATSNSSPEELDEALEDRFDAKIWIPKPHPGVINKLNAEMKGLGDFIQTSYNDEKRAVSPRDAFAFLKLLESELTIEEAALLVFGDRYKDIIALLKTKGVI